MQLSGSCCHLLVFRLQQMSAIHQLQCERTWAFLLMSVRKILKESYASKLASLKKVQITTRTALGTQRRAWERIQASV